MTTYVLIPGAGGAATWFWHRVVPLLAQAGHQALPVDLPGDDERAGLPEYARLVQAAIDGSGAGDDVVLVAHSLGGFTAPLVAAQVPLRALVLVNAMIPVPGETACEWWEHTAAVQARTAAAEGGGYGPDFDEAVFFFHDVPPEVVATGAEQTEAEQTEAEQTEAEQAGAEQAGAEHRHNEADAVFESRCDFAAWPPVPIRAVAGAGDRLFPAGFQQAVVADRLGIEADVLPGGHLIALAQPGPLAGYLLDISAAGP